MGKEVIFIAETPSHEWKSLDEAAHDILYNKPLNSAVLKDEIFHQKIHDAEQFYNNMTKEGLAHIIYPQAKMQDEQGNYPRFIDGKSLYSDTKHLSESGSILAGKEIMRQLKPLLKKED